MVTTQNTEEADYRRLICRPIISFAGVNQLTAMVPKTLGVTLEDRPGGTGWRVG